MTMRKFQTVGFVLSVTCLCLLMTRHFYQVKIRDGVSIFDAFAPRAGEKAALKREIAAVKTFDAMRALYTEARDARDALNRQLEADLKERFPESLLERPPDGTSDGKTPFDYQRPPSHWERGEPEWSAYRARRDALSGELKAVELRKDEARAEFRRTHAAAYERERALAEAVKTWESVRRELGETRFYWGVGLGLFLVGAALFRWTPAAGLAFATPGVLEMIWWATPGFGFDGAVAESDRLLLNRLIMAVVAFLLIAVAYLLAPRWEKKRKDG